MKIYLLRCTLIMALCGFLSNCNQSKKGRETKGEADSSQLVTAKVARASTDDPASMTFKMKLWQQGIDFYARGNEPSWAVDIDMENGIKFSNLDGLVIETEPLNVHQAADAMVTRISGGSDLGEIIVIINEDDCNDTMSDEKFRNSVNVEIKTGGDSESEIYTGCGQYVPDYSLHDIWVLVEANGKKINPDRFPEKGIPTFEFYVEEGRISGHAGCNNINGSFYRAGKDILHFEPFAMTRMMCPDMEIEDLIAQSVAGKRMKYEIKDLKLMLMGYDGTELIFKKID